MTYLATCLFQRNAPAYAKCLYLETIKKNRKVSTPSVLSTDEDKVRVPSASITWYVRYFHGLVRRMLRHMHRISLHIYVSQNDPLAVTRQVLPVTECTEYFEVLQCMYH